MSQHDKHLLQRPRLGLVARAAMAQHAAFQHEMAAEAAPDPRSVTRGSFSPNPLIAGAKTVGQSSVHNKKQPPSRKRSGKDDARLARLLSEFRFDWFQFTVTTRDGVATGQAGGREERDALRRVVAWAVRQGLHEGRAKGGANGYRVRLPLLAGPEGEAVASISSGSTQGILPNITITGGEGACAALAASAQEAFAGLRLSRADAALDVSLPGLFEGLLDMARKLVRSNPKLGAVRVIDGGAGRTFYLGSPSSTVSLRVYQKDLERVVRGKLAAADADPDLTRIEWTFRPQSRSKRGMGLLTAGDMLRTSVWARDFMARAAQIMGITEGMAKAQKQAVEREERASSLESSAHHGARQYGATFARLAVARLVAERGGDYATAALTPEEIEAVAASLFRSMIEGVGASVASQERVRGSETREERTAAIVGALIAQATGQTEERADAVGVVAGALWDEGTDTAAALATADAAGLAAEAAAERVRARV